MWKLAAKQRIVQDGTTRFRWSDGKGNNIERRWAGECAYILILPGGSIYDLDARNFREAKKEAKEYLNA
jgi:hypothetical protein